MLIPGSAKNGAFLSAILLFSFSAAICSFMSHACAAVVILEASMKLLRRSLNSVGLWIWKKRKD